MQRHGIHAGAYLAVFHIAVALAQCNMPMEDVEEDMPQHFDRCMHILRTAAGHTASVADELASLGGVATKFESCMRQHMLAARAALDERMLACQQAPVSQAMLPALEFAAERRKLQYFEVNLPEHGISVPESSQSLRQRCIDALGGVPAPPVPGCSSSEWCAWMSSLQSHHSWSSFHLSLQQVEQHFFVCAERCLACALPSGSADAPPACPPSQYLSDVEIVQAYKLLLLYSQAVAQIEGRDGVWGDEPADHHSPMLQRQLRSRESLLASIVLCLTYQRIAAVEWRGIARYKLPVEPDDLRHLVLGSNQAEHAASVVAEYMCRVADHSDAQLCFSLESEDTMSCVVDYARMYHSHTSC